MAEVALRETIDEDLGTLFEFQADPEASAMADFPSRGRDAFMAHWTKLLADDAVGKRTILFDGRIAGNLVLFGPPEELEVGYWPGRTFWGRGLATRALAAFLAVTPHRPLHAHVATHNAASLRVLEKCGFREVGRGEDGIDLRLG